MKLHTSSQIHLTLSKKKMQNVLMDDAQWELFWRHPQLGKVHKLNIIYKRFRNRKIKGQVDIFL